MSLDKNTFTEVFQKLPVGVFLFDIPNATLIELNPFCRDALHLGEDTPLPVPWADVFQNVMPRLKEAKSASLKLAAYPLSFLVNFEPLSDSLWMGTLLSPPNQAKLTRENRNLKTISRRKSELIANISHELRTPLTAILGWPEIILDSRDKDVAMQAAEAIQKDGEILLGLLEDLIDLSKIEAGKMRIDRRPENLNEVLSNALDVMKNQLFNKSIRLSVQIPREQIIANLDPLRVTQVILNFLSNAIKFTPEEGKIQVVLEHNMHEATISIQDSGQGISEEDHQRIFDRFAQGEHASTGAGIGLALVKSLIEMHQGRTWVESHSGEGATFFFTLPILNILEDDETGPLVVPNWHLPQPLRVLLLDPKHSNQDIIKSMLNAPQTTVVSSDWESLEATVKGEQFQMVLIEASPQNLTQSLNALKFLQSTPELCMVPTLALSTSAMKEDHDKYLHLGFDAHLAKPFRRQDLLKCMHHILKKDHHV